jgi:hypothetical protein
MRADLKLMGDAVIASVRGYVASAVSALSGRIDGLDERIKAIPAGPRGEAGAPGERGEKGDVGAPGADGQSVSVEDVQPLVRGLVETAVKALPPAKDGQDGAPGDPGPQGEAGAPGQDGDAGAPGRDGADGLPGPAGDRGEPGPQGDPGPAGPPGRDGTPGKDGTPGERGKPGEQGEPGHVGKDGRDGRDGKDGAPGRDAFELDILPAIDPTKAYPRGTLAQWQGGIVRALRETAPLREGALIVDAGWTSIVRGVACVELGQSHERAFALDVRYSDGTTESKAFTLPAMIYRGVFREATYERGDVVTWDGSLWHCEKSTTEKPGPMATEFWKLCAKRGRDGRDGERGEKGASATVARAAVRG